MANDSEPVNCALLRLCRTETGDPGAEVGDLEPLPGHAGFSFSFRLTWHDQGQLRSERLVLRLAPPGVRIAGPADVVRQARVMASLRATAIPVAPVWWFGDDPQWFGRPYSVVGFVSGFKLAPADTAPEVSPERTHRLAFGAISAMAALHRLDPEERRQAWGEPYSLHDEIRRLDHLLDRPTLDRALIDLTPRLRKHLLGTIPDNPAQGCVHGDFQWSNCLFGEDRLNALIDWELSQIGSVLLDLGWFCLFSDRQAWVDSVLLPRHCPTPEDLISMYEEAAGREVKDAVQWFRAFSGYRFGIITAFNLMLHRRGKRIDPLWEDLGRSCRRLFERSLELMS